LPTFENNLSTGRLCAGVLVGYVCVECSMLVFTCCHVLVRSNFYLICCHIFGMDNGDDDGHPTYVSSCNFDLALFILFQPSCLSPWKGIHLLRHFRVDFSVTFSVNILKRSFLNHHNAFLKLV
jgi:hypothetical protein